MYLYPGVRLRVRTRTLRGLGAPPNRGLVGEWTSPGAAVAPALGTAGRPRTGEGTGRPDEKEVAAHDSAGGAAAGLKRPRGPGMGLARKRPTLVGTGTKETFAREMRSASRRGR